MLVEMYWRDEDLDDAEADAGDGRAADVVEAAHHHGREALQHQALAEGEGDVGGRDAAEHAGEARGGAGEEGGEQDDDARVDAAETRRHLVPADGPHGGADARLLDEQIDADGADDQRGDGDDLHLRDHDRPDEHHLVRVGGGGKGEALLLRRKARKAVENDPEGDAGDERAEEPRLLRPQRLEADLVDEHGEDAAAEDADGDRHREGSAEALHRVVADDRRPARVGTVRRVEDAERREDEAEADAEEGVERPQRPPVHQLLEEELHPTWLSTCSVAACYFASQATTLPSFDQAPMSDFWKSAWPSFIGSSP